MKIGLAIAPLLLATTAYAEAPGEFYDDGDVSPPGMTPVADPVAPAPMPERPRRWSVGLGFGSLSLAPHQSPDQETEFGVGQIAIRYRATRHLEIELAFSGGSEKSHDDYDRGYYNEGREVSQGVLAARYRFSPERRWNWWLMAGMGTLAVTQPYATDEERDSAQQSTLQFGLGLERRFRRFAIQVEARAVGVKPNEEDGGVTTVGVTPESGPYMEPIPPEMTYQTRDGWAGGQLTLTGNYYF